MFRQVRVSKDREPPATLIRSPTRRTPSGRLERRLSPLVRRSMIPVPRALLGLGDRRRRALQRAKSASVHVYRSHGWSVFRSRARVTHVHSHAPLTSRCAPSYDGGGRRARRAGARTRSCRSCRIRSPQNAPRNPCTGNWPDAPSKSYTGTAARAPGSSHAGLSPIRGRACAGDRTWPSARARQTRARGSQSLLSLTCVTAVFCASAPRGTARSAGASATRDPAAAIIAVLRAAMACRLPC